MSDASKPLQVGTPALTRTPAARLSWVERAALLVGIVEILLQFDKYFAFHVQDAELGAVGGLNISITTISLLVLFGIWFGDAALHRQRTILRPLFGIPMLIYLGINLFSALSATAPVLSLFDFAILFQAYLLFFFIANRVQTHDDVAFCLLTLGVTILLQSLVIFFAAAIGLDDETRRWGPLQLTVDEGRRHGGTMHSPVLAGSTLALIWLPVAASLLFIRSKWSWRFALLATTMGLLAILMTQTRGAILTTVVGSLIIGGGTLWRGSLPKWTLPIVVLLGVISIYPLIHVYQKRIQFGDGDSAVSRKHLSLIALEAISERPLLGYGAGNCHLATQRFADQSDYRAEWFYTIHSKYLLVCVETGVIGLLAFLAVLGNGLRQGISAWRTRDPAFSLLGLALSAALAGHMLHMAVDVFNSRPQVQMLWVILGLLAAVYKLSHQAAFQYVPVLERRADRRQQLHGVTPITSAQTYSRQLDGGVS